MDGAEDLAHEIARKNPEKYFMPNQFANKANVMAHYQTTAEEIWKDTKGRITHFVAGIGTGGTLMGVSQRLRKLKSTIHVTAVQPKPNTAIQGLKNLETQYVPPIWKRELVDEIHEVSPKEAEEAARLLALEEGVFVGSDTMLVAPVRVGARARIGAGAVVTHDIPPDTIAYGVPARVRGEVGDDEHAQKSECGTPGGGTRAD